MKNYSVLMSVYIKEKPQYLEESIKSILGQTVLTNDFVIVCDGPLTDELNEVLQKYQCEFPSLINIVRLEYNVGLGRALNTGMKYCKNDIIARMDSDDISFKERCEEQLEVIERGYDIVSGSVLEFENTIENIFSERRLPENESDIRKFARKRCPFNHPCVMYKRDSVLNAGGYRHFYCFEDYYLWARMLKQGVRGYNLQKPILYMRAGKEMYSRRGGRKYMCSMIRFRTCLLRMGISTPWDWLVTVVGQSVICICPTCLRKYFYEKLLRSK